MSEKLLPCPFCGDEARTFDLNGTAQATCGGKHIDCAGTDVVAPVAMWNRRTPAPEGEAVGTAGAMPGTSGFTTAVFRANAVPVGTPLYASPVVPTPEEDEDFNSYLIEDRLEMTARASASSVFACRLMDEAAEKIKELRTAILAASPIVPVGVSREDEAWSLAMGIPAFNDLPAQFQQDIHDAILAALRPTDTGRE